MEKTIPSCPLAVAGEEEINPQNQKTWHGETITLMTQSTEKNLLKNDGFPLPLASGETPEGGWDQR